jgi:hypothetical protein
MMRLQTRVKLSASFETLQKFLERIPGELRDGHETGSAQVKKTPEGDSVFDASGVFCLEHFFYESCRDLCPGISNLRFDKAHGRFFEASRRAWQIRPSLQPAIRQSVGFFPAY